MESRACRSRSLAQAVILRKSVSSKRSGTNDWPCTPLGRAGAAREGIWAKFWLLGHELVRGEAPNGFERGGDAESWREGQVVPGVEQERPVVLRASVHCPRDTFVLAV